MRVLEVLTWLELLLQDWLGASRAQGTISKGF